MADRSPETSLVQSHGHLALHRRMILVRTLGASFARLLPVPLVDEWLAAALRRGTVRRIAESRHVDLDEDAVRVLADGTEPPPGWRDLVGTTSAVLLARRTLRKALMVVWAARRAEEMVHAFAAFTLIDHYCARLHLGAGLDGRSAASVRAAIDDAVRRTHAGLATHLFRRGVTGAGRAVVRAPFELADAASGGRLRRLLARGNEVAAEEVAEATVERAASRPHGFLARAARAVEDELGRAGSAWISDLLATFERSPALARVRGA